MRIGHFLPAFIILSLITILLLVYSFQFFNTASVSMQISDWMNQIEPGNLIFKKEHRLWPRQVPPQTVAIRSSSGPTSLPQPTQLLLADTAVVESGLNLKQQQEIAAATTEPVFQVIEEPSPDGSLVIPSLGIDLPLVPVLVKHQTWDLTNLGSQIGWLQTTGSHPNDDLAMVLIGHIILPYPGGAGPFLNLSTLIPGDVVGYRSGQETYIYEVKGQTIARPEQVDLLYRRDGKRLLLVTCTGYNALEWKYDLRLIVEAVLVSVEK